MRYKCCAPREIGEDCAGLLINPICSTCKYAKLTKTENLYEITIFFSGGTSTVLKGVTEFSSSKLSDWLGNSKDTSVFEINIPSKNMSKLIRKDSILFIDITKQGGSI